VDCAESRDRIMIGAIAAEAAKAARNSAGSSAETTSLSVSWLGTPRS
jgi:hypothetical protein